MKPKRSRLTSVALLIISALAGCGATQKNPNKAGNQGYQYYVAATGSDSNDGSAAAPWRTISHAAVSVTPGALVHVLPGVYNESVFFDISGAASQRIRFISDTRWGA